MSVLQMISNTDFDFDLFDLFDLFDFFDLMFDCTRSFACAL